MSGYLRPIWFCAVMLAIGLGACDDEEGGAATSDADAADDAPESDGAVEGDRNTAFGPWTEPPALVAEDGVYQLHLEPAEVIIDGERFCLRTYNGAIPGGTIRIPAGDDRSLRIDLHNDFTAADERIVVGDEGYGPEHCYDFNLTNLHFHGAHVRPDYSVGGAACAGDGCGTNPADGDNEANDYYADNVLIEVASGQSAQFRYDIDEAHVHDAGLYWYHPHIHGSTAVQVASGAAGAVVVEGEFDALQMFEGTRERIMIFNHIPWQVEEAAEDGTPLVTPLAEGETCTEETISVNNFLSLAKSSTPLVNGRYRPQLETSPGQVERWRMLHAGSAIEMVMAIFESADDRCEQIDFDRPVPMLQVAADGIPMPRHWERDWLFLAPGYRVELLVQMPEEESTLCVLSGATSTTLTTEGIDFSEQGDYLLYSVRVTSQAGAATRTEIADDLDTQLASVAPPTEWVGTVAGVPDVEVSCDNLDQGPLSEAQQVAVMVHPAAPLLDDDTGVERSSAGACPGESGHHHGGSEDVCSCPIPNFNCRNFNDRHGFETSDGRRYRSDRVLRAGETEHWELSATDAHPYHIHINPFLVCPSNTNKEPPFPHWRDTYFMQFDDVVVNNYEPVHLLMEYEADFAGTFVVHCHKLNHEDEGMMEIVEVCRAGDTDCLCLDGETDQNGDCVRSNAECYDEDLQCQYAAYLMAGFGPAVLREEPTPADALSADERNALANANLEECCGTFPEFGSDAELRDYVGTLSGLTPACCPENLSGPMPPDHPCR